MTLNVKQIQSKKPSTLADGHGLYLKTYISGKKSWIFKWTERSKRYDITLGDLQLLEPMEAREKAHALAKNILRGIYPLKARSEERLAQVSKEKNLGITFEEVADIFIKERSSKWSNAKSEMQWRNTLRSYAYKVIGSKSVNSIDTEDIRRILNPLWIGVDAIPETANRVRGRIESIIDYSKTMGWATQENPARWRGHLEHIYLKGDGEHQPSLPHPRVSEFMAELRAIEGVAARALEFITLTGVRCQEALRAKWSEVDLETKTWTVPAERLKVKNKRPHVVPLSDRALQIINNQSRVGESDLIFHGSRKDTPISDTSIRNTINKINELKEDKDKYRDQDSGKPIVTHGMRSTFRSWCADMGYSEEVAEASLAHSKKGVQAAYQRADMLLAREKLMQAWADYCNKTKC